MIKKTFLTLTVVILALAAFSAQAGLFKVNAAIIIEGPPDWGNKPNFNRKPKAKLFKHKSAYVNEVQIGFVTEAGVALDSPKMSGEAAQILASAQTAEQFLLDCPNVLNSDYCSQLSVADAALALDLIQENGQSAYLSLHLESVSPQPIVSPTVSIKTYQDAVETCTTEAFAKLYSKTGIETLNRVFGEIAVQDGLQTFVEMCE